MDPLKINCLNGATLEGTATQQGRYTQLTTSDGENTTIAELTVAERQQLAHWLLSLDDHESEPDKQTKARPGPDGGYAERGAHLGVRGDD